MSGICFFKNEDAKQCERKPINGERYCIFHHGCDVDVIGEGIIQKSEFASEFSALITAKNGDWRGFVFPPGIRLPHEIDFEVDARGCQFNSLSINNTTFKYEVDFSRSSFNEATTLSKIVYEKNVFFVKCKFNGPVTITNVRCLESAMFIGSSFIGRTVLNINFSNLANLNQVIFYDGVKFSGWRNVTLTLMDKIQAKTEFFGAAVGTSSDSKIQNKILLKMITIRNLSLRLVNALKRMASIQFDKAANYLTLIQKSYARSNEDSKTFRMFETEGQLQDVVFLKPDQTIFTQVDLSKVYFRGTNLRGIRFLGVNWWQPKLKRNGLSDELFIRENDDEVFRQENLPVLEDTCRNARVALEDNKSFDIASDFYIAEMEASRSRMGFFKREIWSINALYRFVSFYGTSFGVAVRIFLLFYLSHLILTLAIQYQNGVILEQVVTNEFINSLEVLFQKNPDRANSSGLYAQRILDVVFRILGLVQLAMVALAFRSRIKRH